MRAIAWLQGLLQLPRTPMLETRRIACGCRRLPARGAHRPARFVADWMQPDTQAGLRAMLARIGK